MTENDAIVVAPEENVERIGGDSLDSVRIGQYWWVTYDENVGWDDDTGETKYKRNTVLMVVGNIASNHIQFEMESRKYKSTEQVRFEDFDNNCKLEPNGAGVLRKQAEKIQRQIQEKMQELLKEGKDLSLITAEASPQAVPDETITAIVPASADPKQYKGKLVQFNEDLPAKTEAIEELAGDLASVTKNITLPQKIQLTHMKNALSVVEDRIFTVELYCGVLETVHLIKDGEAAPWDAKLTLRQMMLYMDEETLFDYKRGGMDFKSIGQFDEWVVQSENLDRILPEPKGVVAFRVRRKDKDYGEARDIGTAWAHMEWHDANKQTYLLIRNGEKVYRIVTDIDFSPRLVPKKDEIGEKQFIKRDHFGRWNEKTRRHETTDEKIDPDHLDYDKHVVKLEKVLKHYNRMIILLQGLLDRSRVFAPHPGIQLMSESGIEDWVNLVRDEEMALPNNSVNWEEWLLENNKGTKRGEWIYSGVGDNKKRGYNVETRPRIIQVTKTRRDGSEVRVSWPWGIRRGYEHRDKWGGEYGKWGEWPVDKMCHQWIKAGRFVNLNHYELGEYKTFLCDRALQGAYLQWARYLLSAEDWRRDQIVKGEDIVTATRKHDRMPKKVRKTVVVEEEEEQAY